MALDKMNMSLEDIIKQDKQGGNRGRNIQRRSRGGQPRRNFGVYRGGVQNNRQDFGNVSRTKSLPDVWKHDLYQEVGKSRGIPRAINRSTDGTMNRSPAVLHISNLDYGVSDTDIKELFGEFGTLVKAAIHYDRSGRSLGNAEVEFENSLDAQKAIKQYNNVPLDGKPMKIVILNENGPGVQNAGNRGLQGRVGPKNDFDFYSPPIRQQNRNTQNFPRRAPVQRGSGRRGGRGGRTGGNKTLPTKEELDAELDAYNTKMET